jgi:tetratricopeptide (TPR) repeat protein
MYRSLFFLLAFLPFVMRAQTDALVHMEKALSAYDMNDLELAMVQADSALGVDRDVPGGYKLRGDIKQRQGDLHGAMVDYVKAEKLDPTDARLFVSRSAINITQGRIKEAMRDVDKAIDLDKTDPDAWYNRACANYLGQNNDGALRDLERCLDLRPENADALFLRGVVKGELYKEESGIADIEAAMALKPGIVGSRMSLAVLLFEDKQYEEAIDQFGLVIAAKDADLKDAHYYRADCYYAVDNKEMACADWRIAAEMGDGDAKFITRNYCNTDEEKIPKKPVRGRRRTVIEF